MKDRANKANGAYRANRAYGAYGLRARFWSLLAGVLLPLGLSAQIKIQGNVYGGGNAGHMTGSSKVTVRGGEINAVFGGARMANVGHSAFVNLDGEHASGNIFINNVYGGNDIAGTIGTLGNTDDVPSELTEILKGTETTATHPTKNAIDGSWNAFVRTSPTPVTTNPADRLSLVVGSLFGGGNGDYGDSDNNNKYIAGTPYEGMTKPVLGKTYLEILGGCIAHLYGGGNNATVTNNTTICINNLSPVLTQTNVWPAAPDPNDATAVAAFKAQLAQLAQKVGLSTSQADLSNYDFNFARVFGGNNKAKMAIRPKWNLQAGVIRDIYSGGNEGAMTFNKGILLQINPVTSDNLKIVNVFGGCRRADVNPDKYTIAEETIDGVFYPAGYSARVLIQGGDITNVYGGNDISGNIYGGNAVGIHSSIKGDVYGGGNGSYFYTDISSLKNDEAYKDFYYDPSSSSSSVDALNAFRPNAEAVSIRVIGTADKKTVIGGAIYCGGNSATLRNDDPTKNATSQLKIGSYVVADKVFLGNNGANMVTEDILKQYANSSLSTLQLTDETVFNKYMDGCAMMIKPDVVFDDNDAYIPYSTYFGSFYCGGNVGSMKVNGAMEVSFNDKVVIFDKVVGGSNEANVYEKYVDINETTTKLNAQYLGGLLGSPDASGNKLIMNFGGLKIQPKRWKIKRDPVTYEPIPDGDGNEEYDLDNDGNRQLEWNTVDSRTFDTTTKKYAPMAPVEAGSSLAYDPNTDYYRRFQGGNVYGGCYSNGHVNGNVVINLNASLVDRKGANSIFDQVEEVEGEAKLYDENFNITQRYTGVLVGLQGMDPLGRALNVFGGGYGADSEIWGSATINLNAGYTFQIFGGGEQGAIGNAISHAPDPTDPNKHNLEYEYNENYSTYINLKDKFKRPGTYRGDKDDRDGAVDYDDMAEAEFIYGGSFEGLIAGSTHINLGNGRIFNSFAGSCNADILGHTETYIGRNTSADNDLGFPWIRDHVYGGNDLGGRILGTKDFKDRVSSDILDKVYNPKGKTVAVSETESSPAPDVVKASAYTEYMQGRVEYIFGGCYGDYDYRNPHYAAYAYTTGSLGQTDENLGTMRSDYHKPWMDNAFVNFKPNNTTRNAVAKIYGAGQGHRYLHASDADRDKMQDRSYILIDAPQSLSNFTTMEVFGAGDYSGVGMRNELATTRTSGEETIEIVPALSPALAQTNADGVTASTVIDLIRGQLKAAYGGSFKEGTTRRTIVNVPIGSTIHANSLFGGAYGRIDKVTNNDVTTETPRLDVPCDVYEAIVNYSSNDATIDYAIYGGNNACRRTLYGQVNVNSPVWSNKEKGYTATIYGAGCGVNTWSQYTEVNLNKKPDGVTGDYTGAKVYEVYGGGEDGKVMNSASVAKWKETLSTLYTELADGYSDLGIADNTPANSNKLYTVDATRPKYYNTNVHINEGATVGGYCYGGGLGHGNIAHSGNVYGTTYIDLLGGKVMKDLYAAGTTGSVKDSLGVKGDFIATATAYIEGGSARNVYGGGWKGSVGHHNGDIDDDYCNLETGELIDIPGETHVIIGILKDNLATAPEGDDHYHLYHGIPYVERNAYGGGEGGAVWGTTNLTMNNGYIGYVYNENGTDVATTANIDERYEEKIEDDTYKDEDGHFQENKRLDDAGCIFGGGYVDNSSVDFTNVKMYGGHVRNALFGGGEIAAIGRGKIQETTGANGKKIRTLVGIYRPGGTDIQMFDGHVHRNVFGGGRGYNNLGESGKLFSDGYVFGQTKVHIHGGEIGTLDELNKGNGNVFGGGDIGYVYSAYEYDDGHGHKLPRKGVKSGVRYDGDGMYQGYYYEHDWADDAANTAEANKKFIKYLNGVENTSGTERKLTEDCEVLIAPSCKVTANSATFNIKYYQGQVLSDNDFNYIQTEGTEELKGKIDAFGKVTAEGGLSMTRTFQKGEYVPTSALNTLGNKTDSRWADLEANTNDDGILIHNAVFAGGNTTKGADNINAFAGSYSVYGNVTATLHDVYHRDLITIGTGHIGGLYGDGNLTLVDGYRGLNITNYGTDYHYLYEEEGKSEMSIDEYNHLLDREQNYYELRYKCIKECKDINGTTYHPEGGDYTKASTLTLDDILTLFPNSVPTPNPNNYSVPAGLYNTDGSLNEGEGAYWKQNGVCSIYAGRILNTIQRADFCGVFGSRMVMQGAQDRVPEVVDYNKYTINRVREVSLNKKKSVIQADINQSDASSNKYRFRKQHGNYFGIYNIVNYLGALTSDVDFGDQGNDSNEDDAAGRTPSGDFLSTKGDIGTGDVRTSDNVNTGTYGPQYDGQTFYGWKRFHHNDRDRNNGNSHNKVALASGVYLELTTEESTGKDLYEKVWGPITGVVELDLINVQQGMGGGFVYAKNIHGKRTKTNLTNTTLTALNAGAVTRWDYTYAEPSTTDDAEDPKQRKWQTSGNFVHSTQTIIDDCYNVSNRYKGANRVPAHYWYIKGSVYVYDQYISAYTGATNAYSEKVDIPLTITAASHGKMKLLNVQPNRYAYRNTNGEKLSGDQKLIINDIEYKLNDPIAYWDWYKLTAAEKRLFEPETYVSIAKYKFNKDDSNEYPADEVLLPADYTTITTNAHHKVDEEGHEVKDENNKPILELWDVEEEEYVPVESIIRSSNNLSHDTGYILTYRVNNPTEWDTWYTEYADSKNDENKAREKKQDITQLVQETAGTSQIGPNEGPTYHLKSGSGELLGQRTYKISDIISQDVKTTYDAIPTAQIPTSGQATFQRAYVATAETDIKRAGQSVHLYKGSTMSETEANGEGVTNVAEAFVCTKTIKLEGTNSIYINSVMTEAEKTTHLTNVGEDISALVEEINEKLDESNKITAANISKIGDLTTAQLNKMTALQKKNLSDLLTRKDDITKNIVPAYYCTVAGDYGGNYYASGINYRGLEAWSSMEEKDRAKFIFNYDALDLLIDPTYDNNDASKEGKKYQYDGATYDSENDKIIPFSTKEQAQTNSAGYSLEKPVEYTATYNGSTNDKTEDGTGNKYLETDVVDGGKVYIGAELTREQFEQLPNVQRHYAPITVTSTDLGTSGTCTFYIVNAPLMIGPTPYTAGNIISKADYDELNDAEKLKVTSKTFDTAGTSYFCREAYDNVTVGTFITSTDYEALTNLQKGFTIHGIAPTETSTLYVSRFSDIDDLSKEKIITVIYEYNYEESDVSGLHITPVTERHVLNIHINFKTGAPIVHDIDAPPIVIPGQLLSLLPPEVIEGASPVQGGGWELYPTAADADNHNGIDYVPDADKLYWYQNGYWLRYYALSYVGGKTYSNKVQVSVANYHDLKEVMNDKEHHYYIDIPDLHRLRDPKIYIKDATDGMNQLKDLFDLSLLTTTPTGDLAGHALLKEQVKQCDNLEFIMQTNVNHTGSWTPIGQRSTNNDDGVCFKGNIHGDGYYISGLNNSLFANLCGNVYNLGVKGSFTGAGVVDEGVGYVENCWTNTTASTVDNVYAVFGNPNDTENPSAKQIVNCYYQKDKDYKTTASDHGLATPMPDRAFYNGEVAYDLNGFYLWKRYWDHNDASGDGYLKYQYYTDVTDPTTGLLVPQTEYYGNDITYCSSGNNGDKYVEDRYADGDFRYAGGEIQITDERMYTDTDDNGKIKFYPIWPDDYLFFGQRLTYGHFGYEEDNPRLHQDVPSHIEKSSGRLLDTDLSNRVYRAPAYFRNSIMSVAHFNPWANLAAYSAPKTITDTNLKKAYPGMTAIDFAGHNDNHWAYGAYGADETYGTGAFYPPLLDDDGLIGVANRGETKNLLVYAPAETAATEDDYANKATYDVLNDYFIGKPGSRTEPIYSEYTETSDKYSDGETYGRIAIANTSSIHGHLVQSDLKTTTDHLLVDKQDFFCPIKFNMGSNYRMWYQRTPDNFVDTKWIDHDNDGDTPLVRTTDGWEGISLPFTTETVSTQDKGELTHFYQGSMKGHEYWLRGYAGNVKQKTGAATDVMEADFNPMAAGTNTKVYTNTFLWDYYYSKDSYWDKNVDEYQKQYYSAAYLEEIYGTKENPKVTNYPYSQGGKPYLIGFPSPTYYEFDLSGEWTPEKRYLDGVIPSPGKQTVSFVSVEGDEINVSDSEDEIGVTADGYTFKTNYLNEELPNGQYAMNDDGNAYNLLDDSPAWNTTGATYANADEFATAKTAAGTLYSDVYGTKEATTWKDASTTYYTRTTEKKTTVNDQNHVNASVYAFRPYFISDKPNPSRQLTRSIVFNSNDSELRGVEERDNPKEVGGSLNIYSKKHLIVVESALTYNVDVIITNTAGIIVNKFTIKPGEAIETRIYNAGVYIVQPSEVRFTKKLSVK